MSANNVIYVLHQGKHFFVWHTDIDSPRGHHMGDIVNSTTLEEAVKEAYLLEREHSIVEYGVQVLPVAI